MPVLLDTDILLKYHSPPSNKPAIQCWYSLHTDKATIDSSVDDPLFGNPYDLLSHLKLAHPDPSSSTTHLLLTPYNPQYALNSKRSSISASLDFDPLYSHNFTDDVHHGFGPSYWILVTTTPVYTGPAEQSSLLELFSSHPAPKKLLLPDSTWPTHYINKQHRIRLDPPFHVHSNKELGFTVISTSASAAQRQLTITRNIHLSIARLRLLHCDIPLQLLSQLELSFNETLDPPSKDLWRVGDYDYKKKYHYCNLQPAQLFLNRSALPLPLLTQRRLRPHYLSHLLSLRRWVPYLLHLDRHANINGKSWRAHYNPKGYPEPTNLVDSQVTHPSHLAHRFQQKIPSRYGSIPTHLDCSTSSGAFLLATYITTELAATLRLYRSLPYAHPLRTISHLHLPPIQPLSLDLYLPPHLHSPSNVFPCPTQPPTESTE